MNNAFYAGQQRQLAGESDYVPTARVSTRNVGQAVEIRVQDNGPAISAAVQAEVFQPGFTTKPAGESTGLGFSLSYDVISQAHGGGLTVESGPGQGNIVTISLLILVAAPQKVG